LVLPHSGNSGFVLSLENPSNLPSRITLKAGGALATGGAAAIVANAGMNVQYCSTLDPVIPADKVIANLPMGSITAPETHYFQMGKGDPVVILHGNTGEYKALLNIARDLSERYDVNIWNSPYNATFTWPDDGTEYTVDNLIGNAIAFIEALGKGPVHLVGHSAGTRLAYGIVKQRPDLVKTLGMIEPALFAGGQLASVQPTTAIMQFNPGVAGPALDENALLYSEFAAMLDGSHSAPFASASQDQRNLTANKLFTDYLGYTTTGTISIRTFGPNSYLTAFRTQQTVTQSGAVTQGVIDNARLMPKVVEVSQSLPAPILPSDLSSISKPTLIINGASTRSLFMVTGQTCAAYIPGSVYKLIANATHAPHNQNPSATADAIMNFLKDK
jgi:pimeloyl-ACP methyl ester carboxylesterase